MSEKSEEIADLKADIQALNQDILQIKQGCQQKDDQILFLLDRLKNYESIPESILK